MATHNAPCFSLAGFVLLSALVSWASGFPTDHQLSEPSCRQQLWRFALFFMTLFFMTLVFMELLLATTI